MSEMIINIEKEAKNYLDALHEAIAGNDLAMINHLLEADIVSDIDWQADVEFHQEVHYYNLKATAIHLIKVNGTTINIINTAKKAYRSHLIHELQTLNNCRAHGTY